MQTYLDYNATAPLKPSARAAMEPWLAVAANPSSVHGFGRAAKKQLEDARKAIAQSISAWPNEIIFTASGTEANTTALRGFSGRKVIVSAIEHSSVKHTGVGYIAVDGDGVVSLPALEAMLTENMLVSVMLANNETGVIQPIQEIAAMCKSHAALLHVDAVQALGKIPVDFSLLGADMLTLSAHKCGGPLGAAALVAKNNLAVAPLLAGGGQELGRRAGTENIAAIAGFAAAVQDVSDMRPLRGWLDDMEAAMEAQGGIVCGKNARRLPNTSCVAIPPVGNEVQLMDFDLQGFAVSAGSACSSGRIDVSHVLLAMGVPKDIAACAIRVSAGWNTVQDDITRFTAAWLALAGRLRKI